MQEETQETQFHPWVWKMPWRKKWQPSPVFMPEKIPWTEKPGGLQSKGLQRVWHDWMTKHAHKFIHTYIYIYICVYNWVIAVQQKLATLYTNFISIKFNIKKEHIQWAYRFGVQRAGPERSLSAHSGSSVLPSSSGSPFSFSESMFSVNLLIPLRSWHHLCFPCFLFANLVSFSEFQLQLFPSLDGWFCEQFHIFGRNLTETIRVVQNFNSGDDHRDCSLKRAPARIIHCEVTLFPVAVNQYFIRKYVKTT